MVRFNGTHDLQDITGKLSEGFRSTALRALQDRLIEGQQDPGGREKAAGVVAAFYAAADKVREWENGFDRDAQPGKTGLDLKANLRSPGHMTDIRDFHTARRELLALPGGTGPEIVAIVETAMANDTATPAVKKQASTGPATKAARRTFS